jgi:probable F420-dependent oxidoreductase
MLAKQAATLDFLSGGRLLLGVGAGWMREEFDLLGSSFDDRGRRAVEMVDLMRKLWTGDSVTFSGHYHRLSGGRMLPRPAKGTIPILWGGTGSVALRRAVTVGDGWHPADIGLAALAAGLEELRSLCAEHGRNPAEITIVHRPSRAYDVDAAAHRAHLDLGLQHVVLQPPFDDPGLRDCRAYLEEKADVCELTRRSRPSP